MPTVKCDYCDQEIIGEPVILIKEVTIERGGIEQDVPVERWFCSEECKEDYQ